MEPVKQFKMSAMQLGWLIAMSMMEDRKCASDRHIVVDHRFFKAIAVIEDWQQFHRNKINQLVKNKWIEVTPETRLLKSKQYRLTESARVNLADVVMRAAGLAMVSGGGIQRNLFGGLSNTSASGENPHETTAA